MMGNNMVCTESETDERHHNRIALDRTASNNSFAGHVVLPIFAPSVKFLEIHISAGSTNRPFEVYKSLDGTSWTLVDGFTMAENNTEYVYSLVLDESVPFKIKIQNTGAGVIYIWQIVASGPNLPTSLHAAGASKNIYSINNTIFTSQAGTLEIYDMKGVRVAHAAITNTYNCDLSKGLYIVRLTTKTGRMYSEKINIK